MQYDPTLIIECDNCGDTIEIEMDFVYQDYSGERGYYDHKDSVVSNLHSEDWIVDQDGDEDKHFCCKECENENKSGE